jgi:2-polyprenyl-3-methyl-5-hydroxy-6-metoxy-1,4-benzoquinol methylase
MLEPEVQHAAHGHALGRHDFVVHAHAHHTGGDGPSGPPTLEQRHAHEAETYDEVATEILASWDDAAFLVDPEQIPFANREHVDFLTDAVGRLGPLAGRRVLEVGAGGGSLAVWLAQQGAEVVGIDVSPGILAVAEKRARINGVTPRTTFVHAPIETFDPRAAGLRNGQFDAIIGNNVVHHFERDLAMANLGRLLAPGAVAVFCEPVLLLPEIARTVRNSPLVARRFPLHTHSPDERSLDRADFATMRKWFRHVTWTPHQLLGRLQNFVELSDRTWHRLAKVDRLLLTRLPFTAGLCRIAVIELGLPQPSDLGGRGPDPGGPPPTISRGQARSTNREDNQTP